MMTVGANWEKYGKVTLPRTPCDLCRVDFFFLKPAWQGEKRKNFCGVCYRTAISGILPDKSKGEAPGNMPIPMMIFAGLGALMMVLGLLFTVVGTASGEMNLVNILFGSFTTAAGFLLLRRTLRNRRLIAGA
jgi:drug/metabolite transporter (DMT)-like permease